LWQKPARDTVPDVWMRLRPWLPAVAWSAVLFGLSCIPGNDLPEVPGAQTDKVAHVALYLVLGLAISRALRATTRLAGGRLLATTCLLATAYGITDELHQLFTPRRSSDWHDVAADAVGGLAGALLATRIFKRAANHP
jgi:VanZ family protein